jgi:aryl-alcohol dehydrogenase-like predicted oxidoreductase
MRHPAVTTVLVGARTPAEIDLDLEFAAVPVAEHVLQEIARTWAPRRRAR